MTNSNNELLVATIEKNLTTLKTLIEQSEQLLATLKTEEVNKFQNITYRSETHDLTFDFHQFEVLLRKVKRKTKLTSQQFMPLAYYLFAEEVGVEPRAVLPDENGAIYSRLIRAGFDREIYNITSRLLDMSKTEIKDYLSQIDVYKYKRQAYIETNGQIELTPGFSRPPELEVAA